MDFCRLHMHIYFMELVEEPFLRYTPSVSTPSCLFRQACIFSALSLLSSLLKTTNGEVLLPRDSWCISPWCAPSWFLVLMLRPTSLSIKEYLFDRVLECLTMLTFGQNHPILSPHSKIACTTMFFESMKNKIKLVTYSDFRYHIQHHQEPPCPPRLQDETWRTGLFLMGFLCSDFDKIFRRALIW